jgi:beta-1,4-mannosyltransferase
MNQATGEQITVLHSSAAPNGTAQFIVHLVEGAPDNLHLRFFSWKTALTGPFDVFHIHWPETLIRSKHLSKRIAVRFGVLVLLARLRAKRIPIVRTLHNVQPHEAGGWWERTLLARIDKATTLNIRLNPTTSSEHHPHATILHGHYRDRFDAFPHTDTVPGRILYFGLIRPYKGVEQLIAAFSASSDEALTLRVVGKPSEALDASVRAAATADPRISHDLKFVEDSVMVSEICEAELVVLPYLQMHNSGALLAALSLDRPVLVPRTPANTAIADEVGHDWIVTFEGALSSEIIHDALATVRARGDVQRPDLSQREWAIVGQQHLDAYREAIRIARSR